jgi:hypothetical protein
MLAGNFALALFTVFIVLDSAGLGLADLGLWLSAGAIVVTRWLDVRNFAGTTTDGAPATLAHWKHHTMIIVGTTFVLWLVAHAVAWLRVR